MSSEGILIFNDKGDILFSDPTAGCFFGYSNDELSGTPIRNIIPLITIPVRPVIAGEKKQASGVHKKGVAFPMEISVSRFLEEEEHFNVAFVSTTQKASKNGANNPQAFLVLDKTANIRLINEFGCRLLNCDIEFLDGLNLIENFLPDETSNEAKATFERALLSGTAETFEGEVITMYGDRHKIKWTINGLRNSSGHPIGTLCTGKDGGQIIDEVINIRHFEKVKKLNRQLELKMKKQTQMLANALEKEEVVNKDLQRQIQRRKATQEKLIKYQRMYDTMVHNFPDGVIGVLDRNLKYVLIAGKELNEIDFPALGLGQKVLKTQDPAHAEITLAKIRKAFEGQTVSFELKIRDRFYNVTAVPLPDEQNHINEILCVLKNTTERKKMEDGLLKALEKEKELSELKSRFVTMASHEFKTPLTTILSSAFLLENYSGEDYLKEKMVHVSRIRRAVNNLTMILNDILSLEKLEENRVKIVNSAINIPTYLKDIISEMELVKKAGQEIDYQHLGDQLTIFLDPNLLWSIITNLISNALKYSPQGGHVSVSSEIKNQELILTVADQGMGIPMEEQEHIFGRFYRARNAGNIDGTGLGLHIVEKNVELFKGRICFTSELNEGTKFTVVLPDGKSKKLTNLN